MAAIPALPAVLQTMTYAEAIPTVVDMCRGREKVRRVLTVVLWVRRSCTPCGWR